MAVAFALYTRRWQRKHRESVPAWEIVKVSEIEDFSDLSASDLIDDLDKQHRTTGVFGTVADASRFLKLLFAPSESRLQTTENVEIRRGQKIHQVEIVWAPGSSININANLVPLGLFRKSQPPREFSVQNGRPLNARQTIALTFYALTTKLALADTPKTRDARELLMKLIAAYSNVPTVAEVRQSIEQASPESAMRFNKVSGFLDKLRTHRPYLVVYDTDFAGTTLMTYRTDLTTPLSLPSFDRWRAFKDRCRARFRQLPRVFDIDLGHCADTDNYRLNVSCDEALYVDETNVWSAAGERFLPKLTRGSLHRTFLGWDDPRGNAFVSLAAVNMPSANDNKLKNLYLILRLREKPPGALAAAASVSFSTLIAIWLVGAVNFGEDGGVDLVAFVLALPAVAASVVGFWSAPTGRELRSLTALLSSFFSTVLSLLAIAFYLMEHLRTHKLRPPTLPDGLYVLYLNDEIWATLCFLAAASFVVVFGTLVMRVVRFASLSRPVERPMKRVRPKGPVQRKPSRHEGSDLAPTGGAEDEKVPV